MHNSAPQFAVDQRQGTAALVAAYSLLSAIAARVAKETKNPGSPE